MESIIKKYQKNEISLYEAIIELDLINKTNHKKNEGVIYTPKYIADYIVEELNYDPSKTIIEPSVGHGVFVFSLIEYVSNKFKYNKEELKEWFESKVYCFDINEKNIEDFKAILKVFFEKKGVKEIDLKNIKNADTLFFNFDMNFDFSFGNPPYIRTKNLDADYLKRLKNKYKSCEKGNVDICYAFTELMNDISDISSFIVPNSYIYNKSAQSLREELFENIEKIIDLKNKLVFKNARTYTSIYKTNKILKSKSIKYKESLEEDFFSVPKKDIDNRHWLFEKDFNDIKGVSITEKYNCYGSIATLRDSLFIIELEENIKGTESFFEKEYNGIKYKIENDICIDFYKITKPNKKYKIIFPYCNNKLIKEEELQKKYPFAYSYLKAIRPDLDQRDKGNVGKYENWFAYGRKQGLNKKKENIFLFLPLMTTKQYKCTKIIKKEMFLTTSGFVLGFDSEEEANKVKIILESERFFNYIKLKGRPWAGKEPYYSFTKTHLKDFLI